MPAVSLLLPAGQIEDGTQVRKVTGTTRYALRTRLPLYGKDAGAVKEVADTLGVCFLVGEDSINIVHPDKIFAVDFAELRDALDFLSDLMIKEEKEKEDRNAK